MDWSEYAKGFDFVLFNYSAKIFSLFVATLRLTFSVLYKPLYQQRKYKTIEEDINVSVILREGGRGHWTVNHTGIQSFIIMLSFQLVQIFGTFNVLDCCPSFYTLSIPYLQKG